MTTLFVVVALVMALLLILTTVQVVRLLFLFGVLLHLLFPRDVVAWLTVDLIMTDGALRINGVLPVLAT